MTNSNGKLFQSQALVGISINFCNFEAIWNVASLLVTLFAPSCSACLTGSVTIVSLKLSHTIKTYLQSHIPNSTDIRIHLEFRSHQLFSQGNQSTHIKDSFLHNQRLETLDFIVSEYLNMAGKFAAGGCYILLKKGKCSQIKVTGL